MKDQYDEKQGYCRMLGHTLGFRYCRTMNSGLPCHNILNCWFERLDIKKFVAENYSKQEQELIFSPPRTRLDALLELAGKGKMTESGNEEA